MIVVGDGVHRLDGRTFPVIEGPEGPAPSAVAGGLLMGVGAGTAGVGLGVHLVAWRDAGVQEDGRVLVSEEDYAPLVAQNRAGLGTAIAGGVVLVAGVVLTVATAAEPRSSSARATVAPWFLPTPDGGVAFGIGGGW